MRLKFFLFLLCLLLTGCTTNKEVNTYTDIQSYDNILIAVNSPTTNIKKLDREIQNHINNVVNSFTTNYKNIKIDKQKSELNIDYKYRTLNERYISVACYEFINSPVLTKPINKVNTWLYDKKTNKFLSFKDFTNKDSEILKIVNG